MNMVMIPNLSPDVCRAPFALSSFHIAPLTKILACLCKMEQLYAEGQVLEGKKKESDASYLVNCAIASQGRPTSSNPILYLRLLAVM